MGLPTTTKRKGGQPKAKLETYVHEGREMPSFEFVKLFVPLLRSATECPSPHAFADVFGRNARFWSFDQIGKAFSTSLTTVKGSWVTGGMPGSAADGWPVAEVCRWFVEREIKNRR